ncbi:hypothetical protein ACFL50_06460 [Candidatus Latescibacterota bacterium]
MNNRYYLLFSIMMTFLLLCSVSGFAENSSESILLIKNNSINNMTFPDLADNPNKEMPYDPIIEKDIFPRINSTIYTKKRTDIKADQAIWPFSSKEESSTRLKPKSTRKAFFLSLLIPGLGETYVGSKRGLIFMASEIFAWYLYLTNTNDGNDLETQYKQFAEDYWHYEDNVSSGGTDLYYNYWEWLVNAYEIDENDVKYDDYIKIKEIVEDAGASHSLPPTKDQQYYEMIGKYDHFVYGWEDIIDNNPSLSTDGVPNGTYVEPNYTGEIKSPHRLEYMNIRGKSNDKLKAGQNGIYIMLLNRIFSAISAGRLAYHHNQKLETDLSKVRIHFVEKYIIDNKVPMIILTKKF